MEQNQNPNPNGRVFGMDSHPDTFTASSLRGSIPARAVVEKTFNRVIRGANLPFIPPTFGFLCRHSLAKIFGVMNTAKLVKAGLVSFVLLFATMAFCENISLYVLPGKQQKYLWSRCRQEGSNIYFSEVIIAETFAVMKEGQSCNVIFSNATVSRTSIEFAPSKKSTNNISQYTLSSDKVDLKVSRGTKVVYEQKLQNLVDLKTR